MVFTENIFDFLKNWALLLSFVVILWYLAHSSRKPWNFPPGPRGFPILGVMPFLGRRPEIVFTKWGKKYGDVIGFKMGKNNTVVLNSYAAIQEAFVQNAAVFNHRPDNVTFTELLKKSGFGFSDWTSDYITERKFSQSTMARLGFGRRSMEVVAIEEVKNLLRQFGEEEKIELDTEAKKKMMYVLGHVVAQMAIGKRYKDYRDHDVKIILQGIDDFHRTIHLVYLATTIFPWMRYVPPVRGSVNTMRNGLKNVCELSKKQVVNHENTIDKMETRDFVDEYLLEINRKNDPEKGPFSNDRLVYMIRDLFAAGMDTVHSTIVFSCLVLANRPEVMEKIHEEIDDIVGNDEDPSYSMREKMPFCRAFLKEIMRYRSLVPTCLPHCTSQNVKFRGYNIPKGTTILANIYAVHNDPAHWDQPEKFKPERHIGEDGNVKASKYFMPFGIGPRICIAPRLAQMEVFIFFVIIFRRYNVIPTPTSTCERPQVPEDSEITGLSSIPPESTPVTLVPRKSE